MDELTDVAISISNGAFVSLLGQWVPSQGGKQRSELQVEKVLAVGGGDTLVGQLFSFPGIPCISDNCFQRKIQFRKRR